MIYKTFYLKLQKKIPLGIIYKEKNIQIVNNGVNTKKPLQYWVMNKKANTIFIAKKKNSSAWISDTFPQFWSNLSWNVHLTILTEPYSIHGQYKRNLCMLNNASSCLSCLIKDTDIYSYLKDKTSPIKAWVLLQRN